MSLNQVKKVKKRFLRGLTKLKGSWSLLLPLRGMWLLLWQRREGLQERENTKRKEVIKVRKEPR